jgi:hypothetical protein
VTGRNGGAYGPRRNAKRSSSGVGYVCDRCWRRAEVIVILPGLHAPRVARVICWEHVPNGGMGVYGFDLERWFDDGPDLRDRSRRCSIRQHWLEAKKHGVDAVELVEQALARALRETG